MDFRLAVVEAYKSGMGTRNELCELFAIGTATIGRWLRKVRESGTPAPLPRGGGYPKRIGSIGEGIVIGLIKRQPDATLNELASQYSSITRVPMSRSTISDLLVRLKITRKKRLFLPVSETVNVSRNYVQNL